MHSREWAPCEFHCPCRSIFNLSVCCLAVNRYINQCPHVGTPLDMVADDFMSIGACVWVACTFVCALLLQCPVVTASLALADNTRLMCSSHRAEFEVSRQCEATLCRTTAATFAFDTLRPGPRREVREGTVRWGVLAGCGRPSHGRRGETRAVLVYLLFCC